MYMMIESAIIGGISVISKRYSEANNKYMKNYNPNEESKYILYLDANSLYPNSMRLSLPYANFKWIEDVENFNIDEIKNYNDEKD